MSELNASHASTRPSSKVITLGGGCFWCTEAVFVRVQGVLDVKSGYCNGHDPAPTYEKVCSGDTGHVEVIRVTYDPQQIDLRALLEIFFVVHDPTTLNRQGNDVGTQYRSGIYVSDEEDVAVAQEVMNEVSGLHHGQVVTELLTLDNYHAAEDYHQDYYANHPEQGYCAFVVAPKVQKFLKTFASRVAHA
jgi:peptide-methionine (S)-S-oxide reductase